MHRTVRYWTINFILRLLFWTKYKKSETGPLLIQQHFAETKSVTSEYSAIYTDVSKDGDIVALAAVSGQQVYSLRLPSAEANAILLALKFVASSDECKFMIWTCLLAIGSCKTQNPFPSWQDSLFLWSTSERTSILDQML